MFKFVQKMKEPVLQPTVFILKWQPADACNPIKYVSILKWEKIHVYEVQLGWWTSAANRFLARQMQRKNENLQKVSSAACSR